MHYCSLVFPTQKETLVKKVNCMSYFPCFPRAVLTKLCLRLSLDNAIELSNSRICLCQEETSLLSCHHTDLLTLPMPVQLAASTLLAKLMRLNIFVNSSVISLFNLL